MIKRKKLFVKKEKKRKTIEINKEPGKEFGVARILGVYYVRVPSSIRLSSIDDLMTGVWGASCAWAE